MTTGACIHQADGNRSCVAAEDRLLPQAAVHVLNSTRSLLKTRTASQKARAA